MKKFDLLKEIKKYEAMNKQEKQYVIKAIDFLENDENPFVRTNLKMHVVAGAY